MIRTFTIPERTIVRKGSTKGILQTEGLEAVRDYLIQLEQLQDPVDFVRPLSQLPVQLTPAVMTASWSYGSGEVYPFFDTGAAQLASFVLPPRFFSGLKQLAMMDVEGGRLATQVWDKFAQTRSGQENLVRTVRAKIGNEVYRAVRSCHSTGYAPYSNVAFVQDLLDNSDEFAKLPVINWRVTDSGMRIRFAAIDEASAALMSFSMKGSVVPMIEAWNSEVGLRRVGLHGGAWKLATATGIGHWDEREEYSWVHRGNLRKIRASVKAAFMGLSDSARIVVEAYNEAEHVQVEDPPGWVRAQLEKKASQRAIEAAVRALDDSSIGCPGTLAGVIDAIGLATAAEESIFAQYELEKLTSKILARGLRDAKRGRIVVEEAK